MPDLHGAEILNSAANLPPLLLPPYPSSLRLSSLSLGQLRAPIYDWGAIIRRLDCGRAEQSFSHTEEQIRQKELQPLQLTGGGGSKGQ